MAGFLIAIISGTLMSLQGAFNTNVTKASSVWVTAMFVQLTALATCVIMWVIDGRPDIMKLFKVDNKITLLGGVIGAFITFTVIKSISGLGIAKAEVTIVVAQIIVSYLLVSEFICFILFFGATAITEGIGRFSEWLAEL